MKNFFVLSLMVGLMSPLLTFAQTDQVVNTTLPPTPTLVEVYNGVCASSAVIAHEDTQQSIIETRQASLKSAVVARRDALSAAYLLSDKTARDTAIKSAHSEFLTAQKLADKIAMDALKAENESFRVTMKSCGATLPPQIMNQIGNENIFGNNGNQSGLIQGQQVNNQNTFRVLRLGLKGEDVKNIQRILGLVMDGVYGPKTAEKVKEWQAQKGLKEDGIIGSESIKEIEKEDQESNDTEDMNSDNSNSSESESGN